MSLTPDDFHQVKLTNPTGSGATASLEIDGQLELWCERLTIEVDARDVVRVTVTFPAVVDAELQAHVKARYGVEFVDPRRTPTDG